MTALSLRRWRVSASTAARSGKSFPMIPCNLLSISHLSSHNKADCTNPKVDRPFNGECRICKEIGHPAAQCPQKPPTTCKNCLKEGHVTSECTAARAVNFAGIEDKTDEEAWDMLIAADNDRDLDDFKTALRTYAKALKLNNVPVSLAQIEKTLRDEKRNVYLIAIEKEVSDVMTSVNFEGKLDCKYVLGFYFSDKPKRKMAVEGWPADAEDNFARLEDAGFVEDRRVPKCDNCGGTSLKLLSWPY